MLPPPEDATEAAVRDFALGLPEAYEDFPWGERAFKVRKKAFVFSHRRSPEDGGGLSITVKVPASAPFLLQEPLASPTGYGLGASGWVSFRFPAGTPLPQARVCAWIDESYRNVAPKALVKTLGPALDDPGPDEDTP